MLTRQYKTLEERDWAELREKLNAYYAHERTFDAMEAEAFTLANVHASKMMMDWFARQDELKLECGVAFINATNDINSMSNSHHVGLGFMERCCNYEVPQS